MQLLSVFLRIVYWVVFLLLLGFGWFLWFLPGPQPANVETDGLVVLTGDAGRVARGVELLEAGRGKRLLISGVYEGATAAELAREQGVSEKLFDCCIDLGRAATSTATNAVEAAEWAASNEMRSVRLITSDYHVPRAALEFGMRVPDVEVVHDAAPAEFRLTVYFREYLKYLARRLSIDLEAWTA